MNTNIFREYDIRGIVGEQLDDAVVATLSRAIGTYFRSRGAVSVALGYDARPSSLGFHELLAAGLAACGCDVVSIGMVPTPVMYHSLFAKGYDAGVMITGSHNPPDHNGFKICVGTAALFGGDVQEIRKIAEDGSFVSGTGTVSDASVLDEYVADIVSKIDLGRRQLKAVVDGGNGMGGVTGVPVYEKLGVELIKLFTEPDPAFPNHHPDPTVAENLQDLIAAVIENKADLGIAFDGDGDRIGVVDETGRIIWGDELMILLSRSILKERPGSTVIAEVKCSQTLFDDIERNGGTAIMERAGHSIIKGRMRETGAALAGEMSGHIFFADRFYGFDDATYAGARLLEILSRSDKKLSEMFAGVPKTFSTPELRVDCPDDIKFEVVKKVTADLAASHDVITIDGARVTFPDGWGLVRASNTQAILVLRFEAQTEERLNAIRAEVEAAVDAAIKEISPAPYN